MRYRYAACVLLALLVACDREPSDNGASAQLDALLEEVWEWGLSENPLRATGVGRHETNHLLPSVTREDQARRADKRREFLERLARIDRTQLEDTQDRISYDMFKRRLEDSISGFEFDSFLMPLNADSGFHMGFSRLANSMPFNDVKDYENYIARMNGFPTYMDQHIALMREGLEKGMTVPQVVLEGYETTISAHVVDAVEKSVFHRPFTRFPHGIGEADQERLRAAGESAIRDAIVPSYQKFYDFFVDEYRPGARESLGASELPNGKAYYEYLVKNFTTLDLTPDEVHEIGLSEVKRIRAEMDEVIRQVGFEGTFAEFLEFLRTDPSFYPKTADELLREASYISKKMDAKLPSLFKTLPRLPYGVQPVPDHIAPKYTAGRYVGPPLGSQEPGYYWVNTYKLETRTLYTLEALTLHEAVPGHHLQNALRMELEDLPNFRRFSGVGAYGEGWGLYSERLGLEAGFYENPFSNFGRLTYEMWRACRLVVDTGVHFKGWTRQQMIDYLASHTALSIHEVTTETDRYISWPGQALGYKMGELKIRELRAKATEALGAKFDVREFHDVILLNGPVPLDVLEELVDDWIEEVNRGA